MNDWNLRLRLELLQTCTLPKKTASKQGQKHVSKPMGPFLGKPGILTHRSFAARGVNAWVN